jgi:hypothetical protein
MEGLLPLHAADLPTPFSIAFRRSQDKRKKENIYAFGPHGEAGRPPVHLDTIEPARMLFEGTGVDELAPPASTSKMEHH